MDQATPPNSQLLWPEPERGAVSNLVSHLRLPHRGHSQEDSQFEKKSQQNFADRQR
jgi:hypothetical protein